MNLRTLAFPPLLLVATLSAAAQPSKQVSRVGIVANQPEVRIIEDGLRDLGWIEGKNIQVLWKTPEGRLDRVPAIVEEFVRTPVDVLVIFSDAAAAVAVQTTSTIPIVMLTTGSVVEDGLVASLARPDRNLTGMSFDAPKELSGKRLALLKSMAPSVSRVAFLIESIGAPGEHEARGSSPETQGAARALGLTVFPVLFTTADQMGQALAEALRKGADGMLMSEGVILNLPTHQQSIHAFAARHRLPVLHSILSGAESGGLVAYGVEVRAMVRRVSYFIDRILKGARPADLPIEQPSRFELVVNRKTAKSLGLAIPQSILVQADRVIE